ncbi:MAG: single-stranded DNA-binding protein [Bdellovibrionaceae bacterium]|nr:single-stranded DNA-binding protein [Pseudobdellovibrionaceae bacterium]
MSLNKAMIIGRLGNNPEVKTISTGNTVANFSIATSENWLKDGEKQERTEWHRIVVWGKMADICGKYLSKGSSVYVEGRIQTRSWEDKDGQKRYTTEINAQRVQFLDTKKSQNATTSTEDHFTPAVSAEPQFDAGEEIPF